MSSCHVAYYELLRVCNALYRDIPLCGLLLLIIKSRPSLQMFTVFTSSMGPTLPNYKFIAVVK